MNFFIYILLSILTGYVQMNLGNYISNYLTQIITRLLFVFHSRFPRNPIAKWVIATVSQSTNCSRFNPQLNQTTFVLIRSWNYVDGHLN